MNTIEIVNALMQTQKLITQAREQMQRNKMTIGKMDGARNDLVHQLESVDDDILLSAQLGRRLGEISRVRRKLKNENDVLAWITESYFFEEELGRIIEGMTGQMQFPEHAVYHPRCSARWGGDALRRDR